MNKNKFYKSDFHRWIIDEWVKAGTPKVYSKDEEIHFTLYWYIRLWGHECGKHYIVGDIGETGKM